LESPQNFKNLIQLPIKQEFFSELIFHENGLAIRPKDIDFHLSGMSPRMAPSRNQVISEIFEIWRSPPRSKNPHT